MTVVLVADDDADIRDLVAFKLEQAGFEVIAVEDGQAALQQARSSMYLCLVCPVLTCAGCCAPTPPRPTY